MAMVTMGNHVNWPTLFLAVSVLDDYCRKGTMKLDDGIACKGRVSFVGIGLATQSRRRLLARLHRHQPSIWIRSSISAVC